MSAMGVTHNIEHNWSKYGMTDRDAFEEGETVVGSSFSFRTDQVGFSSVTVSLGLFSVP